ncbi:hypothetical protein Pfo_004645 [Paulownia fortunei]|nr:hypothetical protein Pfo_004645 [Paulownia fortunei]
MPHRRSTASSILEVSWPRSLSSYASNVTFLTTAPLLLLFAARWLSTLDDPEWWFYGRKSPWDRRQGAYFRPSEGGSPWGVAALIVLLLVLVQYQSLFLDSWFI